MDLHDIRWIPRIDPNMIAFVGTDDRDEKAAAGLKIPEAASLIK
jgi:hypothetical protein